MFMFLAIWRDDEARTPSVLAIVVATFRTFRISTNLEIPLYNSNLHAHLIRSSNGKFNPRIAIPTSARPIGRETDTTSRRTKSLAPHALDQY
jgi:hypothetical protein